MLYTCRFRKEGNESKMHSLMIERADATEVQKYINGKGWFHVDTHPCPYPFVGTEKHSALPVMKDDSIKKEIQNYKKKVSELEKEIEILKENLSGKSEADKIDLINLFESLDGRKAYRPSELKEIAEGIENA